jgi:hypothetical protein
MLQAIFHAWERRLADVTTDRVVRPFDWGAEWIPFVSQGSLAAGGQNGGNGHDPAAAVQAWVSQIMDDTDTFYTPPPTSDFTLTAAADGDLLSFPSALRTPHPANNTVYCRYFPNTRGSGVKQRVSNAAATKRAAVLVLPQWNSDSGGHVGLCKLLAWSGMSALRLSLPYHDRRMPPELRRADYIVSANVARTVQVCRQAVLDARRAIAWLAQQGYDRIGILGTSLGSCLSLLTTAHEPLIRAQALNHISPYFADVVWRGLSTRHVREGLNGHIELERLRALWKPNQPAMVSRSAARPADAAGLRALRSDVSGRSVEELVQAFRDEAVPHDVAVLRCGHYSTGKAPFKFVDGWLLTRFLKKR